jgi:hypothetical protein
MILQMNWKQVFGQRWDLKATLLAGFLASSLVFSVAAPQVAPQNPPMEQKPDASALSKPSSASGPAHRVQKMGLPASARQYYELTYGVGNLSVKAVESGSMLRFSYHVLNAAKAQALNDKKATPYLYDLKSRARLEVPSMEKVGQLRQSSPVQDGRTYWMVFANQQRLVKPGSRVDVVIGPFRAQGLLVE